MDVEGNDSHGNLGYEALHVRHEIERLRNGDCLRVIKGSDDETVVGLYVDEHAFDLIVDGLDLPAKKLTQVQQKAIGRQYDVGEYCYKVNLNALEEKAGHDQIHEILTETREFEPTSVKVQR